MDKAEFSKFAGIFIVFDDHLPIPYVVLHPLAVLKSTRSFLKSDLASCLSDYLRDTGGCLGWCRSFGVSKGPSTLTDILLMLQEVS